MCFSLECQRMHSRMRWRHTQKNAFTYYLSCILVELRVWAGVYYFQLLERRDIVFFFCEHDCRGEIGRNMPQDDDKDTGV